MENEVKDEEKTILITPIEEKKEDKPKRKGHGPLYWVIVIIGMGLIVYLSMGIGEKLGRYAELESGSGTSTKEEANSNENSNTITEEINSNDNSNKEEINSNENSNKEEINSNSNNNSNTTNKVQNNYITMKVSDMNNGQITEYHVNAYAQPIGAAGASNNYYFIKDGSLNYVNAAAPSNVKKLMNDVVAIKADEKIGVVAVTTNTNNKILNDQYLILTVTNTNKTIKITDMTGEKTKTYEVDNSAKGYGAAGMSNHVYYVKDNSLYYVNAADVSKTTKIATGIDYVGFSEENAFIAVAGANCNVLVENSSYLNIVK